LLNTLASMFAGKSGIFDHSMKAGDQAARIYAAGAENVPGKFTKTGEPYLRLKARAYMPRTAKNADLIAEIDAGIKKEVSVGCAVAVKRCSICGRDQKRGECGHVPGRTYTQNGDAQICHGILEQPTDAYEWSFVAVPAQPEAGVIKSFPGNQKKEATMENIQDKISKAHGETRFSAQETAKLKEYIGELELLREAGESYRTELRDEVVRLCALSMPLFDGGVVSRVSRDMSLAELKTVKSALLSKLENQLPDTPQLAVSGEPADSAGNTGFLI